MPRARAAAVELAAVRAQLPDVAQSARLYLERPLPPVQRAFAKEILALGKKTVLLVLNGGSVDIGPELEGADAAIEAFFPGLVGAGVIANSIFGQGAHFNRFGRMP